MHLTYKLGDRCCIISIVMIQEAVLVLYKTKLLALFSRSV